MKHMHDKNPEFDYELSGPLLLPDRKHKSKTWWVMQLLAIGIGAPTFIWMLAMDWKFAIAIFLFVLSNNMSQTKI